MAMHPMNPVDAAWYHMDGPANAAVVNALIITRKPLKLERVSAVFEERLLRFDRFRQRVVEPALGLGAPQWEDVDGFDIGQHLHRVTLPAPRDDAELRRIAGELVGTPLPHKRPLWQAHVFEHAGEGGALLMRYHHCIGDGLAMMTVADALFDTSPRGRALQPPGAGPAPQPRRLAAGLDALLHPQQLLDAALLLADSARVLVKDLLKWPDPVSPFKGEFGAAQRVAWSAPVAVDALKAIGRPFNAKVNDVAVAALAGALRGYLLRHKHDAGQGSLRAMVPVNLRPPERAGALGNEFGLVILDLPIAEADPLQRLLQAKARMDALKRSTEPLAMKWLFNLFGRGPKALEDVAQSVFGSKASLVLTNVPGPRRPLYLAGAAVERMMFWVPHPGDELGAGLSLMSYRGLLQLGVMADARRVPDPERITAGFEAEIERLAACVTASAGAAPGKPPAHRASRPAGTGLQAPRRPRAVSARSAG